MVYAFRRLRVVNAFFTLGADIWQTLSFFVFPKIYLSPEKFLTILCFALRWFFCSVIILECWPPAPDNSSGGLSLLIFKKYLHGHDRIFIVYICIEKHRIQCDWTVFECRPKGGEKITFFNHFLQFFYMKNLSILSVYQYGAPRAHLVWRNWLHRTQTLIRAP